MHANLMDAPSIELTRNTANDTFLPWDWYCRYLAAKEKGETMPLDQQANALLRQRNEMSPGEQREALTALAKLGGEPERVGSISDRTTSSA